jgi:hypothetical protein
MKIFTTLAIVTALASTMAFSASAEIINTDLNTAGDNLVITDTVTGLEFLNLNKTMGMTVSAVKAQLNTTFLGWRLSTGEEASSMLSNLLEGYGGYIDYFGLGRPSYETLYGVDSRSASALIGVSSWLQSYGMAASGSNDIRMYGFAYNETNKNTTMFSNYGPHDESWSNPGYSTWLVRDASADIVDENSGVNDVSTPFALSSLALLGFGAIRRKRNH